MRQQGKGTTSDDDDDKGAKSGLNEMIAGKEENQ